MAQMTLSPKKCVGVVNLSLYFTTHVSHLKTENQTHLQGESKSLAGGHNLGWVVWLIGGGKCIVGKKNTHTHTFGISNILYQNV